MRSRIISAQSISIAIRACIKSSLILLLCSRLWPDSLSLWERAGVRVRSIAGETKGKEFLSSRAVSPHPNPLPKGEGNNRHLTLSLWETAEARVHNSLSLWETAEARVHNSLSLWECTDRRHG